MTDIKIKAIKDSIAHWETMINWVKTQDLDEKVSMEIMKIEINQTWESQYCSLCIIYNRCFNCPLAQIYGQCSIFITENAWIKVNNSKTWQEWLQFAEIMLKQLKSLLPKEK